MFWSFSVSIFSFQFQLLPISQPHCKYICQFFPVPEKKMCYHTLSGHERHKSQEKRFCRRYGTANIMKVNISYFLALSKYHPKFLSANLVKEREARTTTSMSLAMIRIRLYPCNAVFAVCNMTLVSNSSWLNGERILQLNHVLISTRSSVNSCVKCYRKNIAHQKQIGKSLLIGTETSRSCLLHS